MAAWIRALARIMMPTWAKEGLSGSAVLGLIRSTYGEAYRTQTFYSDYREIVDSFKTTSVWGAVDQDEKVPLSDYTWRRWDRTAHYYVQGIAVIENINTGERIEKYISMYTDEHDTKENLGSIYLEEQHDNPSDPLWRAVDVKFFKFYRHRGPTLSARW